MLEREGRWEAIILTLSGFTDGETEAQEGEGIWQRPGTWSPSRSGRQKGRAAWEPSGFDLLEEKKEMRASLGEKARWQLGSLSEGLALPTPRKAAALRGRGLGPKGLGSSLGSRRTSSPASMPASLKQCAPSRNGREGRRPLLSTPQIYLTWVFTNLGYYP